MQFNLLPETDSVRQVLLRPAFAFSYVTTALVTLVITYFMEKQQRESASTPTFLVHKTTYFDILSFTALLSATVFTGSHQITRGIATGQSPPIALRRLQSLPVPLNIICGTRGDRKLYTFVIQMLCFPGAVAVVVLYALSFCVNGPEHVAEWRVPLNKYLAASVLWRLLVSSAVYTLNYLAAHNPTQGVLIPTEDSDAPAPRSRNRG